MSPDTYSLILLVLAPLVSGLVAYALARTGLAPVAWVMAGGLAGAGWSFVGLASQTGDRLGTSVFGTAFLLIPAGAAGIGAGLGQWLRWRQGRRDKG